MKSTQYMIVSCGNSFSWEYLPSYINSHEQIHFLVNELHKVKKVKNNSCEGAHSHKSTCLTTYQTRDARRFHQRVLIGIFQLHFLAFFLIFGDTYIKDYDNIRFVWIQIKNFCFEGITNVTKGKPNLR